MSADLAAQIPPQRSGKDWLAEQPAPAEETVAFATKAAEITPRFYPNALPPPPLSPPQFGDDFPPNAQSDSAIGQIVVWYRSLERSRRETAGKLALVAQQSRSGDGDPVMLAARSTILKKELLRIDGDEDVAKATLRRRFANLKLQWPESIDPAD